MNKINNTLLKLIDEHFDNVDDKEVALTYAACIELGTIMTLYKWGIFKNNVDEHKFRILLCDEDPDNDALARKYKLKVPLWINEVEEGLWDDFYKWLHVNPKLKNYSAKLRTTPEAKKVFEEIQLIKGFDLNRFKMATEQYYLETGEYSLALPKFLVELGKGKYEGFKEIKSKLI